MDLIGDFSWFTHVVIPLLIFLARIADVSIGTIRVIFITKGFKYLAPILAFFEVLIWLAAVQQVLGQLTNIFTYIGYAAGFSAGTFVGIILEEKLSVGKVLIRVITKKDAKVLLAKLTENKYTLTSIGADGPDGKVNLIISIVNRHDIQKIIKIVKEFDEKAFYSIEDVRFALDKYPIVKKTFKPFKIK
ncbi:MAG: DUF2179 domain-containing protein [Candidatus Woesearchaeota archaeon]